MSTPPEPPAPAPDLGALERSVLDAIAAERGPRATMRAWPRALRFTLVTLAIGLVALFFATLNLRSDYAVYPSLRFAAITGVYGLLALIAVWQALRPLWLPPAPAWSSRLVLALGVLAPFVPVLLPELPTAPAFHGHVIKYALMCLGIGAISGTVVLLLAHALDRGGRRATATAVLAAVGAGISGALGLHIHCPINDPTHLCFGHAFVPLLMVLVYRRLTRG